MGRAASAGRCSASKLFFYGNYEGSNDKAIYGGGRANVPTAAMRAGDFRGTSIHPNDPDTGEPFPDQMIPAEPHRPVRHEDHELLLPAAESGHDLGDGYGVFQQFVPETRKRQRADIRLDQRGQRRTTRSSCAEATSTATRNGITFEAGNALTNMPILDIAAQHRLGHRRLDEDPLARRWSTSSGPATTTTSRERQSNFTAAGRRRRSSGSKTPRAWARSPRLPDASLFSGGAAASGPPTSPTRGATWTARSNQNAFSISDNLSWITGGHSLKAGGLWTRNTARDGFGIGVNYRGRYRFNGAADRQRVQRISSSACRGDAGDQSEQPRAARRPLQRLRGVRAGRLEGQPQPDASSWACATRSSAPGTRSSDLLANFIPADGGHHVVPNAEVAAMLPPGVIALDRTLLAGDVGLPDTLINTDKNNFSPRVRLRLAARREQQDGAARRVRPLPPDRGRPGHPRPAGHQRVPLRQHAPRRTLQHGFSQGTPFTDPADFGSEGIDPNIQARTSTSTT